MEENFNNDYIISLANISHKKAIYDFQTKNHLDVTPNENIRQAQVKDIPIFLTRLIDDEIFLKVKFWILTTKEDKTKIIACVALSPDPDDITSAELNTFSVDPEYRNKGIGKEMISFVLNKARELKFSRLFLVSTDYMFAAVNIYIKNGFKLYDVIYIKVVNGTSILSNLEEYTRHTGDKFKATCYELFL